MLTADDKIEICKLIREIAIQAEIIQSQNVLGGLDIYDVIESIDQTMVDLINKKLRAEI